MKILLSGRAKVITVLAAFIFIFSSCEKENIPDQNFDLNVVLRGGKSAGYIKFRQNPDPAKVIDLEIKVDHLLANHEYLLQRAVDAVNEVDGNCTSTTWLTLGKGLTPQTIMTNNAGSGQGNLWRDITAIATGSKFDIHFQVVDATNMQVVLTSDCYDYEVR